MIVRAIATIILLFSLLFFGGFALASDRININTATKTELIRIKHIGEKRAQDIIEARPFSSINDLIKIKGIGQKILADIKEQRIAVVTGETITLAPPMDYTTQNQLPSLALNNHASGIIINEIMPWPEDSDSKEEWIEIFNQNDLEIDISGWQIRDIAGSVKTYTLSVGSKIEAKGFLLLPRPTTKITLNNDSDGLELLSPAGSIADSVKYSSPKKGQTYNRTEEGEWFWSPKVTPVMENDFSSLLAQKETKEKEQKLLADLSRPAASKIGKQIGPITLLAIFTAIFSATIIVALKRVK